MHATHSIPATRKLAIAAYAVGILGLSSRSAAGQATEQQSIAPAIASWSQYFGKALAVSNDYLVVGAPLRASPIPFVVPGGADVLRRDPVTGLWHAEASLSGSTAGNGAAFGAAVAVDGDVVVVGATGQASSTAARAGVVYVFRRDAATGSWIEEQELEGSASGLDGLFGASVAIDGDVIVVGMPGYASSTGAAFVFRYQPASSVWVEEALLLDPNGFAGDRAGLDVAIDGSTIAVGSPMQGTLPYPTGTVGVWTASGTSWTQAQELTPSSATTTPLRLGTSLELRGNQLLVGAPGESNATTQYIGAAYLFERDGSTFSQTAHFEPPATYYNLNFGLDVAVNGNTVVIGQPIDWVNPAISGSAWVFRRRTASKPWVADQMLIHAGGGPDDQLGATVAMSDHHIVLGARYSNKYGQDEGLVASYDKEELSLSISPRYPAPDATIDLEAHRGNPGELILIAVEEISGAQLFIPLLTDVFQANYAYAVQDSAPNPALGLSVGVRAYKLSATGKLVASSLEYVDL